MKAYFLFVSILLLLNGMPVVAETSANEKVEYTYLKENNGWEYIGNIKVHGVNYLKQNFTAEARLYVKVIGGKSFYKIKVGDTEYAVVKNSGDSDYKYKAGDYYFNID